MTAAEERRIKSYVVALMRYGYLAPVGFAAATYLRNEPGT